MDTLWHRTPDATLYRDLTAEIEERLAARHPVALVTASLTTTYLWESDGGRWMLRRPVHGGYRLSFDHDVRPLDRAWVTTCGAVLQAYTRYDSHATTRILAVVIAGPDDGWLSTCEGQELLEDVIGDRLPVILEEGHPVEPCPAYHCVRRYQR